LLTELEQKLLTLALDAAAQPGEWATAWMKLGQSLRERGVDGYGSIRKKMSPEPEPKIPQAQMDWPGSIVLTFGKYKGQKLASIDPGYMRWYVTNCDDGTGRNSDLIQAMKWLLDDLQNRRRSASRK
jgi:uncharacterized protein (DUF3820 family)